MKSTCDLISKQLSDMLNCTVVCNYDEHEELFFVEIFNVDFERFDEVESKVFEYSNENRAKFGSFCIPIMFTPEQTHESISNCVKFSPCTDMVCWRQEEEPLHVIGNQQDLDEEFALAA